MKMHRCDICGRMSKTKIRAYGKTLCFKHMHQMHKYGKFLDNIPRTNHDLNDYTIDRLAQTATFNLYNQRNLPVGKFVIDLEDIELVKYHKWRICHNHVVTGLPARNQQRDVAHVVLGIDSRTTDKVVDHINGDAFDNRKSNLRLVSQADNVKNQGLNSKNSSGFKGVTFDKNRNAWTSEIRCEYSRVHFARRKDKREAVFQRMVAEQLLFNTFARESEITRMEDFTSNLSTIRKNELTVHVQSKLVKHNLWQ